MLATTARLTEQSGKYFGGTIAFSASALPGFAIDAASAKN